MIISRIVLLNREGEEIKTFEERNTRVRLSSANTLPILSEPYFWDEQKQLESAEKYKDRIKRVFYPKEVQKETEPMLRDDIRRLELIKTFGYGKNVLEAGCSDGSVSLKIAEHENVKKIIGIDIRPSAIEDGKKLIKDLLRARKISAESALKVSLKCSTIADFYLSRKKVFDTVCAFEVFEHLAPQDLWPSFTRLYDLLKEKGNFFVSVPNRFHHKKYDIQKRSRWKWFDHRNFFSMLSLEMFLSRFFEQIKFYPLYPDERVEDSIYLICECKLKKNGTQNNR